MATVVQSALTQLRGGSFWSAARQSWRERLIALLLACLAIGLLWFGADLTWWQQALGWVCLLTLLAGSSRRGWIKVLGPVFFWDVVRTARRGAINLRLLYTGFLWVMLLVAVYAYSLAAVGSPWTLFFASTVRAHQLTDIATQYFAVFMAVQFLVALLLTPVGVAVVIPEEKRRQTLEFLLATDLRNHEIVFGILFARLASMGLLLLAGLPVLSILQLVGGVEPGLVLVGFGVTALTATSVASLSFLNSVYARRSVQALTAVYLQLTGYLLLTGAAEALLTFVPSLCTIPSTSTWTSPFILLDVVDALNAGNLGTAGFNLFRALESGSRLDDALLPILRRYAWFHGTVIVACIGWSVWRLRRVALSQAALAAVHPSDPARSWLRPDIGRWPMLWKELFARNVRRSWLVRAGIGLLATVAVSAAIGIVLGHALFLPALDWRQLALHANIWTRMIGDSLTCLLLLQVGFRAAGSIAGERDRQTLDLLLMTPLTARSLLLAKWVGSLLGPGRAWAWLAVVWLFGWFIGGLQPLELVTLPLATAIFAAGMASLGLWISAGSLSISQALPRMILATVLAWGGQWLSLPVVVVCLDPSPAKLDTFVNFLAFGLTPPATLDYLAAHTVYLQVEQTAWLGTWGEDAAMLAVGQGWWLVLAIVLGWRAQARFRRDELHSQPAASKRLTAA